MNKLIHVFLLGLLLFLLYWRFQISVTRFFDSDEFSYMHWTAQVARGEHMYTDFFSYFTPGFMWAFAPIFWIVGRSADVFTVGRVVSFVIFLGILGALGVLWGKTRGWKWALLPMVILAFLPMPYDKFLEIRPDNLATFFGMLGILGVIQGWWFVSGLLLSASLFVLVKMVPIVVVVSGIVLVFFLKKSIRFFVGLIGPWIIFFLSYFVTGHSGVVWYSLTRLPFEVYKSAANIAMEATLFFYPNASFYGGNGHTITAGLLINHALWILAIFVGAYRLVATKKPVHGELLIALTFFTLIFGYVKYFPAKHSQYLIPIAVFIAYYAADGLAFFFDWLWRVGRVESLVVALCFFAYLFVIVTLEINEPKRIFTNQRQVSEIQQLLSLVPLDSRVVDFEGRMAFWPDGYPVSSLAIDTTLSFVTRPPASLANFLTIHPARYIWDGDSGRLSSLSSENRAYIQDHYRPVVGWNNRLWKSVTE